MNIETIRNRGYSELDDCIEWFRIISCNPVDKKLLKQEMYRMFSDYTIALARKIIREKNMKEYNEFKNNQPDSLQLVK